MIPISLLQQNRVSSSNRLPSIYIERKNRCAEIQLHNICRVLIDQKLKYLNSLSKRKVAMILEVKEMKRVNSDSIPHLDIMKEDACDDSPRTSFTRYSKVRSPFQARKYGRTLKQGITADEFLRLGQKTFHNDNDEINRRKGDHHSSNSMSEPTVLEFEDVRLELPIENTEQKQLLNMVRRYRLSSLGNRIIQNACKQHKRIELERLGCKQRSKRNTVVMDILD